MGAWKISALALELLPQDLHQRTVAAVAAAVAVLSPLSRLLIRCQHGDHSDGIVPSRLAAEQRRANAAVAAEVSQQ